MNKLLNNEKTVKRLLEAVPNSLSHAYVFVGPDGSGKKTLAGIFSSAILCHGENKPCGNCASCQMLQTGNHPDIINISPSGPAGIIKVDDIRSMRSLCYIKPIVGDYRVIIIDKAHTMNVNSQNALLKILEEPPEGTIFLLLTSNLSKLLPTIRSRTTIINMAFPDKESLIAQLKETQNASSVVSAEAAVLFSNCVAGEAIDLMNGDNNSPYFISIDYMNLLVGNYLYDFLKLHDRLSKSREHYIACLNAIIKFCADICFTMSGNKENLHYDYIAVATISKKLTKAKVLNIIELLRSAIDTVQNTAVDLRVATTNLLLSTWEETH